MHFIMLSKVHAVLAGLGVALAVLRVELRVPPPVLGDQAVLFHNDGLVLVLLQAPYRYVPLQHIGFP